ncbi:hypothetical protein N7468_009838 [Penicillium chermesinum]|uniref:Uncharacterized protein n=1 Tax=Penicillium chermesinum TaxID=63820 RepID=A0A9W9TCR9_9EURO|nr:uncharacterized protein N7468_009838 [Penicillium chermesinum]KAJ5216830.1 hypothetical protein N7468_009838 [Penicillium chermesinum]
MVTPLRALSSGNTHRRGHENAGVDVAPPKPELSAEERRGADKNDRQDRGHRPDHIADDGPPKRSVPNGVVVWILGLELSQGRRDRVTSLAGRIAGRVTHGATDSRDGLGSAVRRALNSSGGATYCVGRNPVGDTCRPSELEILQIGERRQVDLGHRLWGADFELHAAKRIASGIILNTDIAMVIPIAKREGLAAKIILPRRGTQTASCKEEPAPMQELQAVVRQIGRQQIENTFYRTCYNILKTLQDTVARSADDMMYVFHNGSHSSLEDPAPLRQLAEELKSAIAEFQTHERRAELEMEALDATASHRPSQEMEYNYFNTIITLYNNIKIQYQGTSDEKLPSKESFLAVSGKATTIGVKQRGPGLPDLIIAWKHDKVSRPLRTKYRWIVGSITCPPWQGSTGENGSSRRGRLNQESVESSERRLQSFKNICCKGSAVVRLSDLSAGKAAWRLAEGPDNSDRIARILRVQGCQRLSKHAHVPILIHPLHWGSHVFLQQPSLTDLALPQLGVSPGYTLVPLNRKSLIVAAERYFRELGTQDPWWIVDIYLAEPSRLPTRHTARTGVDERPQVPPPVSGGAYRGEKRGGENYWWGILEAEPGSRKSRYLRTLRPVLRHAFDALLPITGIWEGMSIGVLHKINAMRCDEPIRCYLEHIRQTFRYIVGDEGLLPRIDAASVRIMCSRAPATSPQDLCALQREWRQGTLFQFMEPQDRHRAWANLQRINFIIPTLTTFFQDVLYLEVAQTAMRKLCLMPLKGDETIDTVLGRQNWMAVLLGGVASQRDSLWNLWRFGWQYAFELTHKKDHHRRVPRKREDLDRASRLNLGREPDSFQLPLIDRFFALAVSFGFDIPVQPPIQESQIPPSVPSDFPPDSEDDVDLERRCGKPFTDSIDADRFALEETSLNQVWTTRRVSAGFVRRCVFHAFFAYLRTGGNGSGLQRVSGSSENDTISPGEIPRSIRTADPSLPLVDSQREAEFLEAFGDMPWELI